MKSKIKLPYNDRKLGENRMIPKAFAFDYTTFQPTLIKTKVRFSAKFALLERTFTLVYGIKLFIHAMRGFRVELTMTHTQKQPITIIFQKDYLLLYLTLINATRKSEVLLPIVLFLLLYFQDHWLLYPQIGTEYHAFL